MVLHIRRGGAVYLQITVYLLRESITDFRGVQAHTRKASRLAPTVIEVFRAGQARPVRARSSIMSKSQRSNKEVKKKSLLSPKEKKAAKRDKKNASGHAPFIAKDS